ncbi:hypothetical protein BASA81_010796 [Batrachochytrium salamandrivorans]|nr:hypothetical protein BASA81_010771 [Batrachochytrium salamandrivorans]KAH9251385.1 hypothetical protein BASA81_010796 [Batrachochytrium salamandrivorans]
MSKRSRSSEEEEGEEEGPRTSTTRRGTTVAFAGAGGMPPTKKAAQERLRAKRLEQAEYRIAGDARCPVRVMRGDEHVAELYQAKTVAQLKDWLRANGAPLTGSKPELVQRCMDGHVNGRLPACARCGHGKLQFDAERGAYTCSGYFDEDAQLHIKCPLNEAQAARLPWLHPERGAEGEAEGGAEGEAEAEAEAPPQALLDAVRAAAGPKDAADLVAAHCRALRLALPADEKKARALVGAALMGTRRADAAGKLQFDVAKVVAALREAHPPAAAAAAAAAGSCRCAANEPVAALLDEVAAWEKKKGGENVGFKIRGLKTAAIAVRGLAGEVTEGESLGKPGKNKVAGIGKSTARIIQEFLDSGKTASPHLAALKAAANT